MESQTETATMLGSARSWTDVRVTFRNGSLDEGLLYFVRRCAERLHDASERKLDVIVEHRNGAYHVRLDPGDALPGHVIVERDDDAFLAVRNAFGRLHAVATSCTQ